MKLTSIQDFMNEHYKVEKVDEAKDKDNKELIKALEDSTKHLHKDVDNYKETLKHINDLIKSIMNLLELFKEFNQQNNKK